jgi:exonuclease SbcD
LDFGEEKQPKGFVVVELERTQKGDWEASWEFVQAPTRPFVTVRLDVRDSNDPTQSAINALNQNRQIDGAVVRVQIFVKEAQREQVNLGRLRELLEKRVDHISALEIRSEGMPQISDEPVSHSLEEFEQILRQSPIEWLANWVDELVKEEKQIGQRKRRLIELAQKLMEM